MALGIGLSVQNSVWGGTPTAVVIEDYMWSVPTSGELAPLTQGTVSDFHDTWDLDANDDYVPQDDSTHGSEGYWIVIGGDIQPIAT